MVLNQNTFQEVSDSAGIVWSRQRGTEAFTTSWADLNNDGLLDLWVGGHGYDGGGPAYPNGKFPYRYINNGNGTFTLNDQDFRRGSGGDAHGTTIVDFDNDGDQDVFTSSGGQLGEGSGQPNLFFVNNGGNFQEQAEQRGLQYTIARGRSSLWFDGNNDGLLDVLLIEGKRPDGQGPTAFFEQRADGTFFNASSQVGLNVTEPSRYAQLGDVNGDGNVDLVIQGTYSFPLKVYDFSGNGTWQDITGQLTSVQNALTDIPSDTTEDFIDTTAARDTVIADFNNDGFNDIFATSSRTQVNQSTVFQGSSTIASVDLVPGGGRELGFSLQTGGDVAIDVFNFFGTATNTGPSQIFIGASGRNPTTAELQAFTNSQEALKETPNTTNTNVPNFVLSPNDSSVVGIASNRSQAGLYIGYNPSTQTWEFELSSSTTEGVQVAVDSTQTISNLNSIGFESANPAVNALPDSFFAYNPSTGQYEDRSSQAGVDTPTLAESVVEGDFDNDMDLDLYLASAYPSFNQPNILYDNQGDGTFVTVAQAGGAAGQTVGPLRLDFEVGERVAVADYDANGSLDIFVGSTTDRSSVGTTYLGSPSQLFSNQGNGNNWLEIDLEGVDSNRDGIGSRVTLTTPDGVTQLREQDSGIHHFAQNTQRIHFGLGQNSTISSLVIEWPSGARQEFTNVDINQVINITEGGSIGQPGGVDPGAGNDSIAGTAVGDILSGGDGNDTITGIEGPDSLNGDNGDDSLDGGGNNDVLDGGNDNDILIGGGGADTLLGGAGNDSLTGGTGADSLDGGDGSDRFIYDGPSGMADTISGFAAGADVFQFSASGFGGRLTAGTTATTDQFRVGTGAADSSDRFIYNSSSGDLFFDSDGNGSRSQFLIANLDNQVSLSNTDILIGA